MGTCAFSRPRSSPFRVAADKAVPCKHNPHFSFTMPPRRRIASLAKKATARKPKSKAKAKPKPTSTPSGDDDNKHIGIEASLDARPNQPTRPIWFPTRRHEFEYHVKDLLYENPVLALKDSEIPDKDGKNQPCIYAQEPLHNRAFTHAILEGEGRGVLMLQYLNWPQLSDETLHQRKSLLSSLVYLPSPHGNYFRNRPNLLNDEQKKTIMSYDIFSEYLIMIESPVPEWWICEACKRFDPVKQDVYQITNKPNRVTCRGCGAKKTPHCETANPPEHQRTTYVILSQPRPRTIRDDWGKYGWRVRNAYRCQCCSDKDSLGYDFEKARFNPSKLVPCPGCRQIFLCRKHMDIHGRPRAAPAVPKSNRKYGKRFTHREYYRRHLQHECKDPDLKERVTMHRARELFAYPDPVTGAMAFPEQDQKKIPPTYHKKFHEQFISIWGMYAFKSIAGITDKGKDGVAEKFAREHHVTRELEQEMQRVSIKPKYTRSS